MTVLTVDDLVFELRRSARRKTLEIIIDRGGELVVAAPEDTAEEAIRRFIHKKRFRVYTKLAEKEKLRPTRGPKEYVSGESFHYLGRTYRLLLVDDQDAPMKLLGGRFRLLRSDAAGGKKRFIHWYTDHARPWLTERMKPWAERVGVSPGTVEVRPLGHRWASCSPNGRVNFHWATIQLPPSIIDYLIVHELVHLHEHDHTPGFWKRVERAMPDFASRKQWLAENGAEYVRL
ncbi:M48 family metallopeptidase [Gemmatimonadota bacterium]